MPVSIRFEKMGLGKGSKNPKAKEVAGAWITTESGYYKNRFVSWRDLESVVQCEEDFKNGGQEGDNAKTGKSST